MTELGYSAEVIRTGRTLLANEGIEALSKKLGSTGLIFGDSHPKSLLLVPLLAGGQTQAIIVLNDMEREHAFSPDDVRLLETLAASMSVALQNARLFHETQRLLKETEQRNAELAVINSIQQAIGAELDFQGIVDTVGDKLREVFATQDMSIRWSDQASQHVHTLYIYEHGNRLPFDARPLAPGTPQYRFYHEDRKSVTIGSIAEQLELGIPCVKAPTARAASWSCRCWRAIACWARSTSRTTSATTRSARPKFDSWKRSHPAWAWHWKMRASSTRRSGS